MQALTACSVSIYSNSAVGALSAYSGAMSWSTVISWGSKRNKNDMGDINHEGGESCKRYDNFAIFGRKQTWLSIRTRFEICNDQTFIYANLRNKGFLICLYFNIFLKKCGQTTTLKLLLFPCRFDSSCISFFQHRYNFFTDENRKGEFGCKAFWEVLFAIPRS